MLALTSACSLHSLDYLGAGGGNASTTGGDAGAKDGDGPADGGRSATGGWGDTGGAGTMAPGVLDAGAAGSDGGDLARCDDLQKNGEETDLDCGGRMCGPCAAGKTCAMGTDCESASAPTSSVRRRLARIWL